MAKGRKKKIKMISVQQISDKTRHALEGMQVQLNIVLQIVYQLVDTSAVSTQLTSERTVSSAKESFQERNSVII